MAKKSLLFKTNSDSEEGRLVSNTIHEIKTKFKQITLISPYYTEQMHNREQ